MTDRNRPPADEGMIQAGQTVDQGALPVILEGEGPQEFGLRVGMGYLDRLEGAGIEDATAIKSKLKELNHHEGSSPVDLNGLISIYEEERSQVQAHADVDDNRRLERLAITVRAVTNLASAAMLLAVSGPHDLASQRAMASAGIMMEEAAVKVSPQTYSVLADILGELITA